MAHCLDFQIDDHTALLRLDRPNKHNAVNDSMMAELEAALETIEATPEIRSVIVTGAGERTFCAGGDLAYFARLEGEAAGRAMSERMQAILHRLATGDRPVIAAINGQTLGGGCEILTACHLRLAAEHATFGFLQARNGLITGWGGGSRLFDMLGKSRALELLLTARRFDSSEALRLGFVNQVVPAADLLNTARRLAQAIAETAPGASRAFLELARTFTDQSPEQVRQQETELFVERWQSAEFRRAVDAFLQR